MKPAIVVTGASSGIGREIGRVAARDGNVMVLVGLGQPALDDLAAELGRSGVEAHALCIDLADRDAAQKLDQALAHIGVYCDVLVNSAGSGLFGAAAETNHEEQLKIADVNIRALTELTLRFLPDMIARRRGGVLNLGSVTAYSPGPNMSTYFASKAYVRSFTAALAREVAGTGVTVTCLSPGVVRTALFERFAVADTWLFKLAPRGNATKTAAAGWRGFRAGKRLVIPRLMDRIVIAGAQLLPDAVLLRLITMLLKERPPRTRRRPISP